MKKITTLIIALTLAAPAFGMQMNNDIVIAENQSSTNRPQTDALITPPTYCTAMKDGIKKAIERSKNACTLWPRFSTQPTNGALPNVEMRTIPNSLPKTQRPLLVRTQSTHQPSTSSAPKAKKADLPAQNQPIRIMDNQPQNQEVRAQRFCDYCPERVDSFSEACVDCCRSQNCRICVGAIAPFATTIALAATDKCCCCTEFCNSKNMAPVVLGSLCCLCIAAQ
jgi:hypothetical protein